MGLREKLAPLLDPAYFVSNTEPVLTEPIELPPPETDSARIALIEEAHALMRDYSAERLVQPLNADVLAGQYLGKYIDLVEATQSILANPGGVPDALAVAKCLKAVKFTSSSNMSPAHVSALLDWVNYSEPEWPSEEIEATLSATKLPESPTFWRLVHESLAAGRLQLAKSFLDRAIGDVWSSLDADVQSPLSALVRLVGSYPLEGQYVFREWRNQAINLESNAQTLKDVAWREPLVQSARLLYGRSDAVAKSASSWFTAVSAFFMYTEPAPDRLGEYFTEASKLFPVDMTLDWEEACASIFKDNILHALTLLERLDGLSALVLAELSFQAGFFQGYKFGPLTQRILLAILHAVSLVGTPELVSIGLSILENMGTTIAKNVLTNILPQLGAASSESSIAALALAERLNLPETTRALHLQAASRNLAETEYVEAIEEFYDAGDSLQARDSVWNLFEKFLLAGHPLGSEDTLEILRSTGPKEIDVSPPVKSFLAPLAVLTTLLDGLRAAREDDVGAAHEVIASAMSLLRFPGLPLKFYPLIVAELVGVPLSQELDTHQVVVLMASLDSWDVSTDQLAGLVLLEQSRQNQWAVDIDPAYTTEEVIWMLRRRLANDVFGF